LRNVVGGREVGAVRSDFANQLWLILDEKLKKESIRCEQ
jgi:hypothetical protein